MLIVSAFCVLDGGPPIFIQRRVGLGLTSFHLLKFRTLKVGAPEMASHLLSDDYFSPFGKVIRMTKLDELPQLFNVILGHMSLVGPRPCLESQVELVNHRTDWDLYRFKPGITGLPQIMGIDMSDPVSLVRIESEMMSSFCTRNYFLILIETARGLVRAIRSSSN